MIIFTTAMRKVTILFVIFILFMNEVTKYQRETLYFPVLIEKQAVILIPKFRIFFRIKFLYFQLQKPLLYQIFEIKRRFFRSNWIHHLI